MIFYTTVTADKATPTPSSPSSTATAAAETAMATATAASSSARGARYSTMVSSPKDMTTAGAINNMNATASAAATTTHDRSGDTTGSHPWRYPQRRQGRQRRATETFTLVKDGREVRCCYGGDDGATVYTAPFPPFPMDAVEFNTHMNHGGHPQRLLFERQQRERAEGHRAESKASPVGGDGGADASAESQHHSHTAPSVLAPSSSTSAMTAEGLPTPDARERARVEYLVRSGFASAGVSRGGAVGRDGDSGTSPTSANVSSFPATAAEVVRPQTPAEVAAVAAGGWVCPGCRAPVRTATRTVCPCCRTPRPGTAHNARLQRLQRDTRVWLCGECFELNGARLNAATWAEEGAREGGWRAAGESEGPSSSPTPHTRPATTAEEGEEEEEGRGDGGEGAHTSASTDTALKEEGEERGEKTSRLSSHSVGETDKTTTRTVDHHNSSSTNHTTTTDANKNSNSNSNGGGEGRWADGLSCRCCHTARDSSGAFRVLTRTTVADEVRAAAAGDTINTRNRLCRWRCVAAGCGEINSLMAAGCRRCGSERMRHVLDCPSCGAPNEINNVIAYLGAGQHEDGIAPFSAQNCYPPYLRRQRCRHCRGFLHGAVCADAPGSLWMCGCGVTNAPARPSCQRCRLPRVLSPDVMERLLVGDARGGGGGGAGGASDAANTAVTTTSAAAGAGAAVSRNGKSGGAYDMEGCTQWVCAACDGVNTAAHQIVVADSPTTPPPPPQHNEDATGQKQQQQQQQQQNRRKTRFVKGDSRCRHCGQPWHCQPVAGGGDPFWRCACHAVMPLSAASCAACGLPAVPGLRSEMLSSWTMGDWYCRACGAHNYRERQRCVCGAARPTAESASS